MSNDPVRPTPDWIRLAELPEWTPLRHRMLRRTASEEHSEGQGRRERVLSDEEESVMQWLYDEALLVDLGPSRPPIDLWRFAPVSKAGMVLLAIWDREHPDGRPEVALRGAALRNAAALIQSAANSLEAAGWELAALGFNVDERITRDPAAAASSALAAALNASELVDMEIKRDAAHPDSSTEEEEK